MEAEKIKAILLATACFLMACLNLWNEFKDWFDRKYQARKGQGKSENQAPPTKEPIPDIVGKTKFRLPENYTSKKQETPVKVTMFASGARRDGCSRPLPLGVPRAMSIWLQRKRKV